MSTDQPMSEEQKTAADVAAPVSFANSEAMPAQPGADIVTPSERMRRLSRSSRN